jgi:lipopolysaccharide export system protein LptA
MNKFSFVLSVLLCIGALASQAQSTGNVPDTSAKEIIIEKADIFRRVVTDSATEMIMLIGNVVMRQGKTLFTCDSAVRNISTHEVEAFGNVHINDGDSVDTYSQYLKYLELTRMAFLKNKVKLTDGKGILTTNELQYDMNLKIGTYHTGGKVVNGKTILTSNEGVYYADKREAYFISKVKLNDPEYKVSTDTLLYDINNNIAKFVAPTTIFDGQSTIKTREGFYDMKNGLANFGSRPVIQDSSQIIIADHVQYDKTSGNGHAEGKVVYTDTAQGVRIHAGDIQFNSKSNQVLASQKPTMIIKQNKDSLFIAADSFFSALMAKPPLEDTVKKTKPLSKNNKPSLLKQKDSLASVNSKDINPLTQQTDSLANVNSKAIKLVLPQKTDTVRYFQAYHHVQIFSDSLQGVCDSLYFSNLDSTIRMFTDPVLWTKNNQLTGDTIILITKNQQPFQCLVFDNSFAVSRTTENFYNQLKGTQMFTQFINGSIDYIRTKGSAESVYYLQDSDSAYFGMNYSMADAITMAFDSTGLKRVSWINAVEGTTFPMLQIPEDKKKLRAFRWLESRRPKTKWELINR